MKKIIPSLTMAFAINANAQLVTTLCGSTTYGSADGIGATASFKFPSGVTSDGSGNLYVADQLNNEIRKIVIASGEVTTIAGSTTAGSTNGTGASASFNHPCGLVCDGSGNIYVADVLNNEIRKIVISNGVVTTLCGNTTYGSADGIGGAAYFNDPIGITYDGSGNLFVADQLNNEIRKIVISSGVVTTIAGSTISGSTDGTGSSAHFHSPQGVVCDGNGNLYIADHANNEIRKIVIASGVVTTLCGTTTSGSANGTGSAASFTYPTGITYDESGNLYVADMQNNEIRKIVIASGVVTTIAGSTSAGSADGTGAAARFADPVGVVFDGNGNLYVADQYNNEIRKISNITGVGSLSDNSEQVSVYPNPTNGTLTVATKENDYKLIITNILGKKIYQSETKNQKLEIDLSKQPKGIYFVKIYYGGKIHSEKIVVQ